MLPQKNFFLCKFICTNTNAHITLHTEKYIPDYCRQYYGSHMKQTQNKILLTGGASGIDLGLTEIFLANNNTVIVCDRRISVLQELQTSLILHRKIFDNCSMVSICKTTTCTPIGVPTHRKRYE